MFKSKLFFSLALIGIFAAGFGSGYLINNLIKQKKENTAKALHNEKNIVLRNYLKSELKLSEKQLSQIDPVVAKTSYEIDRIRGDMVFRFLSLQKEAFLGIQNILNTNEFDYSKFVKLYEKIEREISNYQNVVQSVEKMNNNEIFRRR